MFMDMLHGTEAIVIGVCTSLITNDFTVGVMKVLRNNYYYHDLFLKAIFHMT